MHKKFKMPKELFLPNVDDYGKMPNGKTYKKTKGSIW